MNITTDFHYGDLVNSELQYEELLALVRDRFLTITAAGTPIFATTAKNLFELFLSRLPLPLRQHHNCRTCKHFFDEFGGLAVVNQDDYGLVPLMWLTAPPLYKNAVHFLYHQVARAKVTGVFLSSEREWGTPRSERSKKDLLLGRGPWHHVSVTPPVTCLHASELQTAEQKMAEKTEDYRNVCRALGEYRVEHLANAVALLKAGDTLYRGEKVLGAAEWLLELQQKRAVLHGAAKENATWLTVAKAPAGFCHPRSSVIGTLLDDLKDGLPLSEVQQRFADKMHPLRYLRPQAAPSVGNIEAAERVVEKLGIASSLRRRYARLDEVQTLWKPLATATAVYKGGVFSQLKQVDPKAITAPAVTMTWAKFARTVLPSACQVSAYLPYEAQNFTALTTAVDPEAPPILQWDKPEQRNPVAWYSWLNGSLPQQWGLSPMSWVKVNAICARPPHWYGGNCKHVAEGVMFILDGAQESKTDGGLALFPEMLKNELHGVRSTIEAFSKAGKLEGLEEASACGISCCSQWGIRLRVTDKNGCATNYVLDRFD